MDEQKYYHLEALKGVFSSAPCGIGIFAAESRQPLFLNDAYYRQVGYTPEEYQALIANEDQKLIYSEDLSIALKNTERFSSSGVISGARFRITRKNGEVGWVELCATPITVDGVSCGLCFFEDITGEKAQFTQLKLVAESIGNSICVLRIKNGKEQILYANDTFFSLIGVDRESYLANTPAFDSTFTSESDRARTQEAIRESLLTGRPQELEYRFLRPGADPLWMHRRLSAIREETDNSYLMVSVVADITERKKAELTRALEQRRYQVVIDEMKAAVFEWDLQSGEFYSSDNYKEYAMGMAPPELILSNSGPSDAIHPDDIPAIQKFFADTASGARRAETTLRLRLTAGGYRWCRLVGLFYADENGFPTRTIGMIINIDEEREKSFMLDSLLNELPGGVAVFRFGETQECLYYNDSFARISHRSRQELDAVLQSGQLFEMGIAPPDLARLTKTIAEKTAAGDQININFRFLTKEGELGWLHMNASKLREEDGCPVYYCVFTRPSEETLLYRDVVEDSVTGVLIAEQRTHRIVYCNKTLRQFCHIPPEEAVLGQLLFDVIPPDCALLTIEDAAALPEDSYTEYRRLYEDHYFKLKARSLTWNGMAAYIVYLSDETQEYQIRLQREELLNLVPVGIGIYDIDSGGIRQMYMNDGYFRMIGDTRESREKKQRRFLDLAHPDDLPQIMLAAERCIAGSQHEVVNHRILCGDESYRWFRLAASVVKRDGGSVTIYCSYVDIDDAIKSREALENANGELQKQYARELSQRQMLEKDSMVAIQFNVTKDKLISYRVNHGFLTEFARGTPGTDIRPSIDQNIPTDEERRTAEDFFNRDKALERYRGGTREFSAVYRRRLNNGRLCWINSTCRLARDEESGDIISYTYMHNIDTERKKELTAESVIDEETDFVLLLNTVAKTAMLLRIRNDYQGFEDKLYQEFPFEAGLEKRQLDIVEPSDRPTVQAFFRIDAIIDRLKTEPVYTITYRHHHADGRVRRKKMRAFYLDSTHEDIVIARRDITDLYEEELEQKRTLEKALVAATSASRAKSDFLSRMSHDLRTPMNVIMGSASLALDSVDDPKETEKALVNITNSSKYLLGLINDCLDIEKINSGKVELHPAPYPYLNFYNDIKAVIDPLCRQKNITLVMDEVDSVEPAIIADKTRMEQIFYNLLSNAVKFTPAGGTVEMLTRNISVSDGVVSFDSIVRDNGIGMSEDFQGHMFEAFAQENDNASPEYQGTGLGLVIVKQLVELMGAEIGVKSTKGVGTEFAIHFRFPLALECLAYETEKPPVPIERLNGKRVLLVEDHPLNRMIAKKLLEKAGIDVTEAENGREAVDRFKSVTEFFFDAILMDIRMPVMNGQEAARAIRALPRGDAVSVPIIAMTANAFDTDVEASIRAGMTAHLSKPIEPQLLYSTLAELTTGELG